MRLSMNKYNTKFEAEGVPEVSSGPGRSNDGPPPAVNLFRLILALADVLPDEGDYVPYVLL